MRGGAKGAAESVHSFVTFLKLMDSLIQLSKIQLRNNHLSECAIVTLYNNQLGKPPYSKRDKFVQYF